MTAVVALGAGFVVTLAFFGEQPTPREEAIAEHAGRVFVWALVTPVYAWAALRGGRRAVAAFIIWFGLLAWCQWWWWPGPPENGFDTEEPLWAAPAGRVPWGLVGVGLFIAVAVGWRSSRRHVRLVTAAAVAATVIGAALSLAHLDRRRDSERPRPVAEGPPELAAVLADPVWDALPEGRTTEATAVEARLMAWDERQPTSVYRRLAGRDDRALFRGVVSGATRTGWTLVGSRCFDGDWRAELAKELKVGPAALSVSIDTDDDEVRILATVEEISSLQRDGGQCWPAALGASE